MAVDEPGTGLASARQKRKQTCDRELPRAAEDHGKRRSAEHRHSAKRGTARGCR